MSVNLLIGRWYFPEETDEFFEENLCPSEIPNKEIFYDVLFLKLNHPLKARIQHYYNLVMGKYYF